MDGGANQVATYLGQSTFPEVALESSNSSFSPKSDVFHLSPKSHHTTWLLFENNLSPNTLKIAQSGHTDREEEAIQISSMLNCGFKDSDPSGNVINYPFELLCLENR